MDQKALLIDLGIRIKNIRINKGLSQKQLAKLCKFEKSSMCKIEQGKVNISYLILYRICYSLNIKMAELI